MMDPFILKLVLSFIIGAIWVTLATIASERFGTKAGGIFTGFPSTSIITFFFIGWTQDVFVAKEATAVAPLVNGIDAIFVVVYILLLRFGFWKSLTASLMMWFISAISLAVIGFNSFLVSITSYVVLFAISYYMLEKKIGVKSQSSKMINYTLPNIVFRAVLSGSVITFAVLIAKLGGPVWGGAFSMFPATFLSTILITHFAHGKTFSSAVMKSSTLSASSITFMVILIRYTYPAFGLVAGTIVSLTGALIYSLLFYQFFMKKGIS